MTAGAFFLDWMRPDHRTDQPPAIELMARGAGPLVWREIQLDASLQSRKPDPDVFHFVVYPNGDPAQTESWQAQRALGRDGVVRIGLLAASTSRIVTPMQEATARELVSSLQAEYDIPGQRISWPERFSRTAQPHPS
jgi:hypothetical protein